MVCVPWLAVVCCAFLGHVHYGSLTCRHRAKVRVTALDAPDSACRLALRGTQQLAAPTRAPRVAVGLCDVPPAFYLAGDMPGH